METSIDQPVDVMHAEGVYTKSIQSGKWYLASVMGQKIINLVSFFILVRLLQPKDYGVMGIAMLVLSLFGQFTNPAFGESLMQRKDSIERYLDPYWTLDLLRVCGIAGVVFFTAGPIGAFFHLAGSDIGLIRASGLLLLIPAFGNIRLIYLFKRLDFHKIFIRDMVAQIGFTAAAIAFAVWVQATAWALFTGYLVMTVVGMMMSYVLVPTRPVPSLQFKRLYDLIGYSKWVYGHNMLDLVIAQLDRLIVARQLNPTELGVYSKGKDLAATPTSILAGMINKVGFPAFSMIQDRMEKVRIGFVKSVEVIALISLPITLLILLEGGALVTIFLGPKWSSVVLPLKIFAFGNLFIAFVQVTSPVFGALARPDIKFKTNVLQAVVSVPLMTIGITLAGVNGLAAGIVIAWIVMLLFVILKARPILNIPKRMFSPVIISSLCGASAVLVFDILTRRYVHANATTLITLAWIIGLGLLYMLTVALVGLRYSQGPWQTLLSIFRELGMLRRE